MKKLHLENFKAFKSVDVDFADLTILSGVNGGGKSSIIQSLLLLAQTRFANVATNQIELHLNGYYLKYFDKNELLHVASGEEIVIEIDDEKFITDGDSERSIIQLKDETDIVFFDNFDFISADRFGPKRYHEDDATLDLMVGKQGENAIFLLSEYYSKIGLRIEEYLKYLFGEKISLQPATDKNSHVSSMTMKNYVSNDADFFNPIHMPFGLSYILPILVAIEIALTINKDQKSIVIVENPEAHLHPSAQSRLGNLFASKANENLQLIIETHSEHIINGALKSIKSKGILPKNISINFFTKGEQLGSHKVDKITINENSELSHWPQGFMDQFTNDSYELLS